VGEHEARTFLVVPLIKSLGWDEKHVKIEWEHKDVVLFDKPYSPQSKPSSLSNLSGYGRAGDDPEQQAKKYTESNRTCDGSLLRTESATSCSQSQHASVNGFFPTI